MIYQPSPYDMGLTGNPDATWDDQRQDQAATVVPRAEPPAEWFREPEGYREAVDGMDDADMADDQVGVLGDRYGWAEAESTKPDRYRTAQLDQADRETEA
jgi:hypothetical protein